MVYIDDCNKIQHAIVLGKALYAKKVTYYDDKAEQNGCLINETCFGLITNMFNEI